jgi:hypothetical protein
VAEKLGQGRRLEHPYLDLPRTLATFDHATITVPLGRMSIVRWREHIFLQSAAATVIKMAMSTEYKDAIGDRSKD